MPGGERKTQRASNGPRGDSAKAFSERTLYLSANLIGQQVEVQVRDGTWYQGLFHASSSKGGYGVLLKCAKKIVSREANQAPVFSREVLAKVTIQADDLVQVVAKEITFVEDSAHQGSSGFKTDSAISHAGDIRERELKPWKPDDSVPVATTVTSNSDDWDQFSTNEKLFGVKTTFDEDIYTTKLDKQSDFYRQNEMRAARLAQEINSQASNNVHIASDRGLDLEMDEETLYGAVIRNPDVYVPPSRRKGAQRKNAGQEKKGKGSTPPQRARVSTSSASPKEEPRAAQTPIPEVAKAKPPTQDVSSVSSAATMDEEKLIGDLYCEGMERRMRVDPSKADPHWKGSQGRGSYLIVPEEPSQSPYSSYNPYNPPPMGMPYPNMGYYPPYGAYPPGPPGPMPTGYPGYPGMMSMGYPPDYNYK